jgi:hypothetical protein
MTSTCEYHDTIINMTTRAFLSDKRPRLHRILVCRDGEVCVYDSVAEYYTSVHSMTERSRAAARRKAGR